MTNRTLTRDDWVAAALSALRKGGPQAIKVESIAKALDVSKGSFYWHFKNASDLRSAMLEHWVAVATTAIIDAVEGSPEEPSRTLEELVRVSVANLSGSSRQAALNQAAIRDWARYDSDVAKVMKTADKMRLNFVTRGFELAGFKPKESLENARILYAALIGMEYLAQHDLAKLDEDLPRFLTKLMQTSGGR